MNLSLKCFLHVFLKFHRSQPCIVVLELLWSFFISKNTFRFGK